MKSSVLQRVGCGLLIAASFTASAATNGFFAPGFRGSPQSEAGYWEFFSVREGPPGNLPDRPGATTDAILTQTAAGTIPLTSSNIYSPTAVTVFHLADTTPYTLGTVVLQTHTGAGGNELDYGSLALSYIDGLGTHTLSPVGEAALDLSNGASHFWQWNLTGLGVTSYAIDFHAAESSTSFDAMTLDTWTQFVPVPEPSVIGLGSIGAAVLAIIRSRKAARGSNEIS